MFLVAAGCFAAPFTLGPEVFGVLLGIGEAGTFKGAGPIADIADWKKRGGQVEGADVTPGGWRAGRRMVR